MGVQPTRPGKLLLTLLVLVALFGGFLVPQTHAFSNGQAASLALGVPSLTVDGHAGPDRLRYPGGIAVDPTTGAVFVADTNNHRVLRFDSLGSLASGAAAVGVLGQPDLSSNLYEPESFRMVAPQGITVDSAGRLWVADTGNDRVLRFDNAASKPDDARLSNNAGTSS